MTLPDFDIRFPENERLPTDFEVVFRQLNDGRCCIEKDGVVLGDPLSDSIRDPDGYRFHDVFHLTNAAILHWSPTFRALIRHKRKSDSVCDETQDGGRAIVIEEGLTAWVFSCAKSLRYFEGQSNLPFDLLKTVRKFVEGFEVEKCPFSLWERAILDGYRVFRQVRDNCGGVVVGNRITRTIEYIS